MRFESVDGTAENIDRLAKLFPNVVTEAMDADGVVRRAVNYGLLRAILGEESVSDEIYAFTWPGKGDAVAVAGRPTAKTLCPCVEKSEDWENTNNLYIEGDNLDVLKLLQQSYRGQVKMIYIDPPYNTGNDFIYRDRFVRDRQSYEAQAETYVQGGNRPLYGTHTSSRLHSGWCSMIYPRLVLARSLLREDGVIFISIDDGEAAQLRLLCDEVFGERNFLGTFVVNSTPNARDYGHMAKMHEYTLFYAKNALEARTNLLPEKDKVFKFADGKGGFNIHPLYNSNEAFTDKNRPRLYYPFYLYPDRPVEGGFFEIGLEKREGSVEIYPPRSVKNGVQFVWRWGKPKAREYLNTDIIGYRTGSGDYRIVQKMRHTKKRVRSILSDKTYSSRRGTAEVEALLGGKYFSFPKPYSLIQDFIKVGADSDSIILDFFSGSATTAHAVMRQNAEDGGCRRFILVQSPEPVPRTAEAYARGYETIFEIGRARIRQAAQQIREQNKERADSLDVGFRVLQLSV